MKNHLQIFMQRALILLLAGFFLWNCQSINDQSSNNTDLLINQEITSEEDGLILVGLLNREAWQKDTYQDWFVPEYNAYEVDEKTLSEIKPSTKSLEIKVFLGTWCSDSQREVPRFYKILDFLKFNEKHLQVVGLDSHPDRRKQSPQHEEEGWNIEYVPTIILLRDGKEIGRIVESPEVRLEEDLKMILKKGDKITL